MSQKIMVIGAHADDIELNTGGTLLKYRAKGYGIIYVMSTNNMSGIISECQPDGSVTQSRFGPVETMARRKSECDAAAAALGTVPIHLDHPQRHYNTGVGQESNELRYGCVLPACVSPNTPSILTAHEDSVSQQKIKELILENDPECIFTHSVAQKDMEHVGTSLLVTKSYWSAVENGYQGALLHWVEGHSFLGEHYLQWETFVDITGWLEKKIDLIALHRCQMPNPYRPDFSPFVRNQMWGTTCGCQAAEIFLFVRRGIRRSKYGPIYGQLETELINNTR